MKHLQACRVAVAMAAATAWPVAVHAVLRIELQAYAIVEADVVRLHDVARIHANNTALAQSAAWLVLGPAPLAGEMTTLDSARIASWLRRQRQGEVWSVDGAPSVRIARAAQTLTGITIEKAAHQALDKWLAGHSQRHSAKAASAVQALALPVGELTFQTRAWPVDLRPSRRMRVWIDVLVAGRRVRAVPVDFDVEAWGSRWILQRDVAAGQLLAEADVAFELSDLTMQPGAALDSSPVGKAASSRLRAGQALGASHVAQHPAVTRGSTVTLRSRSGLISLFSTAHALQDGQPGQRIRVRPAGAGAWLEAHVVSNALVEVTAP